MEEDVSLLTFWPWLARQTLDNGDCVIIYILSIIYGPTSASPPGHLSALHCCTLLEDQGLEPGDENFGLTTIVDMLSH